VALSAYTPCMPDVLDLCTDLPERRFAPGECLLEQGDPPVGVLYVLVEGSVEVLKGDVQVTIVSQPGAFFGEIALFLDIAHTATVRALEPTRCYVAVDGQAFLASSPALTLAVGRLLARRLYLATTYLADLKRQFEDQATSLSMVDEVLETLVHHQDLDADPGSDREREPNY
jgi:CRP/FNR family transcriptional regulator, cyclic AMP receptor protein